MNMMDMLKKSLAFGLGAASFSADKLKQFADEMVAHGEMSTDEAKHFMDDVTSQADEQKKTIENWMREQASKMLQQAGAAEASKVDQLERRIAALERRVYELAGEDVVCCECAAQADMVVKESVACPEDEE